MSRNYENLPRNFATEQWLGVIADQNEEIIRLLSELAVKDGAPAKSSAKVEEITEPSTKPAPARAASRSTAKKD